MTDLELRKKAFALGDLMNDTNIPDETILAQINEIPELLHAKHKTGMNPFMTAVRCGRIFLAQALCDMGADIHWECAAAEGNSLNVARTPEQADEVLAMGVEIEKNLLLSKPFKNPAIVAAGRNNKTMMFYWLAKQKEIFADDEKYVAELFYATVEVASFSNQSSTMTSIISDESLFPILKEVYSKVDNVKSIRLYLSTSSLKRTDDDDKKLDDRKKELRKILNARKKELSSTT